MNDTSDFQIVQWHILQIEPMTKFISLKGLLPACAHSQTVVEIQPAWQWHVLPGLDALQT